MLILGLHKEAHLQFFKCVSFWLHSYSYKWEGCESLDRFNPTSWVAVVAPTDRPWSVYYRCVVEDFVAFLCCLVAILIFLWVKGLLSQDWVTFHPFSPLYLSYLTKANISSTTYLIRNYFPKRPYGAPLHTLSKLYDVPVGFVTPYLEAVYCFICGRQRVAVARYWMICLVLFIIFATRHSIFIVFIPYDRS